MKKEKSKREFSAGGVVYKKEKGRVWWLVAKHSGYHKWILPKGLIEEGESSRQTALREVEEECGIKARVIKKIKEPEKYMYKMGETRIFKVVSYFLMEYESGDIKNHDWEMEEVEWLEFEEAKERLQFAGAKKALEEGRKILDEEEKQLKLI